MMETFQAYQVVQEEGRTVGRMTRLGLDDLNPGNVTLRVTHSSINYKDALAATGKGRIMRRFPLVAGIDVAGVVLESSDPRFTPGDEAFVTGYGIGEEYDGGYCERARVSADWLVPLPEGLTLHDAMAIGTAGFTAALAIQRMEDNGLRPGTGPVVVSGASGGLGSMAVNILAGLGYEVTAITGKEQQHDYLRALGATTILPRQTLEMGTRPLESAQWAGAVDPVGGPMLAWLTRTAMRHASVASCGLAGGHAFEATVMPFILRGVNILGVDSVAWPMDKRRALWQRLTSDMRPRDLARITRAIPFDELPDAFDAFMDGTVTGRTVVRIAT
jgi:acrylyl-CoA reductase (NADPH)